MSPFSVKDLNCKQLTGHSHRVCSVRFNKTGSLLVSCCFGGLVKVWNMQEMKCLSSFDMRSQAYSAIFLPTGNDEIIACGGHDSTILTYDWNKEAAEIEVPEKKKHAKVDRKVDWGKSSDPPITHGHKSKITKRMAVCVGDDLVADVVSEVQNINLDSHAEVSFDWIIV